MPLFAFLGAFISRLGAWFMAKYLSGALRTIVIYTTFLIALTVSVYALVDWVNNQILGFVNNMAPVHQTMLVGVASFLPPNMPYLLTTILTYYAFTGGIHLAIEISRLKARWADKALGAYK